MKILFVAAQKQEAYQTEFMLRLCEFLKKKHTVSIATSGAGIKAGNKTVGSRSLQKIRFNDWDAILAQDNDIVMRFKSRIEKTSTPLIFFVHNSRWPSQPAPIRNLLKTVILSNSHAKFVNYENMFASHLPVFVKQTKVKSVRSSQPSENNLLNILFLHDEQNMDINTLFGIVQFVNLNENFLRLTVVTKPTYHKTLRLCINSNTILRKTDAFSYDEINSFDIVYTSGMNCLVSAWYGVPVVTLGIRGYGGLLTEANLTESIYWNLQGRIGGALQEDIPHWILFDDLHLFKSTLNEIKQSSKVLAKRVQHDFSPETIFSSLEREIQKLHTLTQQVNSEKCLTLRPRLSNGIQLFGVSQDVFHIMNPVGTIMASVSIAEKIILEMCNGALRLNEIIERTEADRSEILSFINELWYNSIIIFDQK